VIASLAVQWDLRIVFCEVLFQITIQNHSLEVAMRSPKSDRLFKDIVGRIETGAIAAGSQLPTHRELARRERVSLSVVNRAYRELKRQGLAEAAGRRGTVLTKKAAPALPAQKRNEHGRGLDVIDLSHNYAALPELDSAMKRLFASAISAYCDDPTHVRTEALMHQIGRQWMSLLSIPSDDLAVLGCWGGQHGIQACLLAFAGLNEAIAVEPFTYTGLKLAASVLGIKLVSVEADRNGMMPAALERADRQNSVKAIYLMPSFQNPLGTTMPASRRRELAEVCSKRDFFIIEDDPHRYLMSNAIPSFIDLAPDRCAHVTTMSKVLGPAMRLGFVATSPRNSLRLQSAIRSGNWTLPLLEASVMTAALDQFLPKSVLTLRKHARKRQVIARKIFDNHEIVGSRDAPHFCLKLQPNWKSSQLSAVSLECGIKISAGALYVSDKTTEAQLDFIRVSLMSEPTEPRLVEGLHRLHELINASPAAFLSAS
jgi:DNA-binding transcriptional MocR family regulator